MNTRNTGRDKGRLARKAWRHRHLWADCLENVGTSASHTFMGVHGLLQMKLYISHSYGSPRPVTDEPLLLTLLLVSMACYRQTSASYTPMGVHGLLQRFLCVLNSYGCPRPVTEKPLRLTLLWVSTACYTGTSAFHTPMGVHGLLQRKLFFTFLCPIL
jgi:hypothetical protein